MDKETKRVIALRYMLPPFVTLLIVSVALWLKHIFPFGTNTIDYYDMGQQIAAFYYHVYDALHGTKSLFYDWYSALGTNMTMNTSGCSSISFFNLLLYFVPRDGILQALSIFTMVKMACMSLTMYHFLHKTIHADAIWEFCFSVCYGLCGFAMMYYITNQWLDVAVIFPLLICALVRLCREGRMTSYVVYLTICLAGSYYQSFMILILIVLSVGMYYLTTGKEKKEERKAAVLRLAIGTLLAFGISAFILVPQLIQTFGSTRFENNNKEGNFYLGILKQVKGVYTTRWWSLLGLSLPFAVILRGIVTGIRSSKTWKEYRSGEYFRKDLFFIGMIIMVCLELLFESVNLMWHFGSYVGYPIRNGFIMSLVVLTAACYYTKRQKTDGSKDDEKSLLYKLLLGSVSTAIIAGLVIYAYQSRTDWVLRSVFHLTALICGSSFLLYSGLLWSDQAAVRAGADRTRMFQHTAVVNLLLAELLIFAYIMLGKPAYTTGYSEQAEQSGSYIAESIEIKNELGIQESTVARIKNPDTELNANYPFIMQHASLSNWTHMIEPSFQRGAVDWGYSIQYMRVLDAGGTVFSDALIGIRNVISVNEQPEELYEEIGRTAVGEGATSKEYILYRCKYTLPFGIAISGYSNDELDAGDSDLTKDRFAVQNEVYALLQPETGRPFIETVCTGDGATDAHQQIDVKGRQVLYFAGATSDSDEGNMVISVNGKQILVPTIGSPEQVSYPAYFNNNLICLGVFENERVRIDIAFTEVDEEKRIEQDECFSVGAMDLDLLENLCSRYSSVDTKAETSDTSLSLVVENAPADSVLLLPVKYDRGFHAKVNAVDTGISQGYGIFTVIPLQEGNNQVIMNFIPTGMKAGSVISLLALLAANYLLIRKRKAGGPTGLETNHRLQKMVWVIFIVTWATAILIIYVIPILYAPIGLLTK